MIALQSRRSQRARSREDCCSFTLSLHHVSSTTQRILFGRHLICMDLRTQPAVCCSLRYNAIVAVLGPSKTHWVSLHPLWYENPVYPTTRALLFPLRAGLVFSPRTSPLPHAPTSAKAVPPRPRVAAHVGPPRACEERAL